MYIYSAGKKKKLRRRQRYYDLGEMAHNSLVKSWQLKAEKSLRMINRIQNKADHITYDPK